MRLQANSPGKNTSSAPSSNDGGKGLDSLAIAQLSSTKLVCPQIQSVLRVLFSFLLLSSPCAQASGDDTGDHKPFLLGPGRHSVSDSWPAEIPARFTDTKNLLLILDVSEAASGPLNLDRGSRIQWLEERRYRISVLPKPKYLPNSYDNRGPRPQTDSLCDVSHARQLDAEKALVQCILDHCPPEMNCGLRTLGGSNTHRAEVDCRATELLVPLAIGNHKEIADKIRFIQPVGPAPLEYALKTALETDLKDAKGRSAVLLILSGGDTCGGDVGPSLAAQLRKGVRSECDVVSLNPSNHRYPMAEFNSIVHQSRGRLYDFTETDQLLHELEAVTTDPVKPRQPPHR
jgi:hypothetical protein